MPARPSPPSSGKQPSRRSPKPPPASGLWIWILIGLLPVAYLLYSQYANSIPVDYSDFLRIVTDKKLNTNLERITFSGTDRVIGEFHDLEDIKTLPPDLRKSFESRRVKRFWSHMLPFEN